MMTAEGVQGYTATHQVYYFIIMIQVRNAENFQVDTNTGNVFVIAWTLNLFSPGFFEKSGE